MHEQSPHLTWKVESHDRTFKGALMFAVTTPDGHDWTVVCKSDGSWSYVTPSGYDPRPLQVMAVQAAIGRYLVECYHVGQLAYVPDPGDVPTGRDDGPMSDRPTFWSSE